MDGRVASFLQQESMFWSRELWDKCGHIIKQYKMARDYHLWKEFAKYESLYTLDSLISGFRIHKGQKSSNREKYYKEVGPLTFTGEVLARAHIITIYCIISSLFTNTLRLKITSTLDK